MDTRKLGINEGVYWGGHSSLSAIVFLYFTSQSFKEDGLLLEALAKNGGDGSRTHVRRTVNFKHYMFSLELYSGKTFVTKWFLPKAAS